MSLESVLEDIARKLETATFVKVGFLEGAKYPDDTSVPMVAAIQNFGAPAAGIPPRPFFTNMVKEKSPTWGKSLGNILKNNGYDAASALDEMGEIIQHQLQAAIVHTDSPSLSPVTVMLRGMRSKGVPITGKTVGEAAARVAAGKTNYGASTKVLVDTGHLLKSTGHKVE